MMASQAQHFDAEEQRVRIVRAIEEAQKFSAESRKLVAEMEKLRGELTYQPWSIFFQGSLAATAVVGSGVAIAKLFLS